jgi:hypothetical protein
VQSSSPLCFGFCSRLNVMWTFLNLCTLAHSP